MSAEANGESGGASTQRVSHPLVDSGLVSDAEAFCGLQEPTLRRLVEAGHAETAVLVRFRGDMFDGRMVMSIADFFALQGASAFAPDSAYLIEGNEHTARTAYSSVRDVFFAPVNR